MLIPAENEKDLADLPQNVKDGLTIIPVSHVDEVLAHAFTRPFTPIEPAEADLQATAPPPSPAVNEAPMQH